MYNRKGIPCLFVYEQEHTLSSPGSYLKKLPQTPNIIRLQFGTQLVFTQDLIFTETWNMV